MTDPEQRDRRDTSEAAQRIVVATEALLTERPLGDISVAEIIEAAGVARGTFYLWFRSKHDVVIYATHRIIQGVVDRFGDPTAGGPVDRGQLREGLATFVSTWREHGAILAASGEVWRADPALRDDWVATLQPMIELVSTAIGPFAPADGPSPELLAHALIWMVARTTYMAGEGMVPVGLHDELIDAFVYIWVRVLAPG